MNDSGECFRIKGFTSAIPDEIPLKSIALSKNDITLNINDSDILEVIPNPSNTTDNYLVSWTSEDSTIASVDTSGKVTELKRGSTTITATTETGLTASCDVTVVSPVTSIKLNKTELTLNVNQEETLLATVVPGDADDRTVTWSSSNQAVATVNKQGKVTAISPGNTNIKVESIDGKTANCNVVVKAPIISVVLNKISMTLTSGASTILVATINPVDTTDDKTLTWKSTNPAVASVDKNGLVNALKTGQTTITVETSNGYKANCNLTVLHKIPSVSYTTHV